TGLTVGYHSENLHQPTPATTSLENTVRQAASRWLDDKTADRWGSADANSTQAANSTVRPSEVQIVNSATDVDHHLAWNDSASLPAAAAIANAIHDATGVRLRQPPFEGEALRRQLGRQQKRRKRGWLAGLGALAATAGGIILSAMPWRPAIAPAAFIDTSIYSEEALNRGRLVAIAGDCMVCHTADSGPTNAGGLGLETPFGTIYSTNITPDKETGIGSWTYAAFERAMREGIHQDGRHLYPAFPYTAFAKISDADMQALYAWLMTQEPVKAQAPKNDLRFPYSVRPLLAGWNALFHRNTRFEPDPEQSTLWNRGAYLVNGMGHCAACHSPRNALGAEKNNGLNFLGGGFAEGWEAPPLNELSKAPLPWTESDLYTYLRTGFSSLHGVAAGPMAPVVKGLSQLPDSDVRAMAHYLASFAPDSTGRNLALEAAQLEDRSRNDESTQVLPGESLFDGACVMCHDARGGPPLFGARPSLALNTNLHSDLPDNVIQVLLHGIEQPALDNLGTMPAFGDSFNDEQLATLLRYMRTRFAPDKAPWQNIEEKIRQYRSSAANQQ
ncbi:MAG TPA: cytochrome c, partial [Burkholderiaceae bacterium]|nr:cytochrome c [Burkholderiaceae bacterium]